MSRIVRSSILVLPRPTTQPTSPPTYTVHPLSSPKRGPYQTKSYRITSSHRKQATSKKHSTDPTRSNGIQSSEEKQVHQEWRLSTSTPNPKLSSLSKSQIQLTTIHSPPQATPVLSFARQVIHSPSSVSTLTRVRPQSTTLLSGVPSSLATSDSVESGVLPVPLGVYNEALTLRNPSTTTTSPAISSSYRGGGSRRDDNIDDDDDEEEQEKDEGRGVKRVG